MKIEIDYFPYADRDIPCGAQSDHEGVRIYGYGKTWEEAKQRVLENLKAKIELSVPPREIVELPEPEDVSEQLATSVENEDQKGFFKILGEMAERGESL